MQISRRLVPLLAPAALTACNWVSLAANALTYETVGRGEASNIAVLDSLAYVTLGDDGFAIANARTGAIVARVPPPRNQSADDIAIAGGRLYVLDAQPPGHLTVYSLADPASPVMIGRSREVPVGPFSGVSANDSLCIVSGGTSHLTAWRLSASGVTENVATGDLGRGQPDVLLDHRGLAFVSTHYWGPYFGLDIVRPERDSLALISRVDIEDAGFTAGGSKPANFPIELAELNDTTVLVAYARGVAVIDAANPAAPRIRAIVDVGGAAVNVDAAHGFAAVAVAGVPAGVVILDSSARVVRRITLPTGTNPSAVAFQGARADRVLVAARDRGVMVLER